jgi:hypothetical protein
MVGDWRGRIGRVYGAVLYICIYVLCMILDSSQGRVCRLDGGFLDVRVRAGEGRVPAGQPRLCMCSAKYRASKRRENGLMGSMQNRAV